MKLKICLLLPLIVLFACVKMNAGNKHNIIPLPEKIEYNGLDFTLDKNTEITANYQIENFLFLKSYLLNQIQSKTGIRIATFPDKKEKKIILFKIDNSIEHPGGYDLTVTKNSVTLAARRYSGFFYGIQTFLQLLPVDDESAADRSAHNKVVLPGLEISDSPQFEWRGMHLDVSRHFFEVNVIKKFIDYMAMYKFNVFHWHLTDDQGWRIEIEKYPKLTNKGAWREEADGSVYGGYYTQKQVREIVDYADKRNITIVPEIDMPGHCSAAVFAYPEIGCTENGPEKIPNSWGIFEDILNPGKEKTFEFTENVLSEIIDLFPGKYIHIGGDEIPTKQWENNSECQIRMKQLGLKKESQLQGYFVGRINQFLKQNDRKLIGWNDLIEGSLKDTVTLMAWWFMDAGKWSAERGHDVIMTPTEFTYFDRAQGPLQFEPKAQESILTLEKVYSFKVLPKNLPTEYIHQFLGGQACVWTEYISTPEHLEYMILPRMLALSETLWSPNDKTNYSDFKEKLPYHLNLLDKMDVNYRLPTPDD